jgi:hypothetical protein
VQKDFPFRKICTGKYTLRINILINAIALKVKKKLTTNIVKLTAQQKKIIIGQRLWLCKKKLRNVNDHGFREKI